MRVGKPAVVTHKSTVTVSYTCDICKQPMPEERGDERHDCRLHFASGDNYPEGDAREHYNLDVCPGCFHARVRPLLKQGLGVDFHITPGEDDYYDKMEPE